MKKTLLSFLIVFSFLSSKAQNGNPGGSRTLFPWVKNNPSDNTVTGFANLTAGGYHTGTTAGRDSLITNFSAQLVFGMIYHVIETDATNPGKDFRYNGIGWNDVTGASDANVVHSINLSGVQESKNININGTSYFSDGTTNNLFRFNPVYTTGVNQTLILLSALNNTDPPPLTLVNGTVSGSLVNTTPSAFGIQGYLSQTRIANNNTKAWPLDAQNHPTLKAFSGSTQVLNGASGSVDKAAVYYGTFANLSNASFTVNQANLIDITFGNSANGGIVNYAVGIRDAQYSIGKNGTGLLFTNSDSDLPPTGYWSIYNTTGHKSYLGTGALLINQTTDDGIDKLQVTGGTSLNGSVTINGTGAAIANVKIGGRAIFGTATDDAFSAVIIGGQLSVTSGITTPSSIQGQVVSTSGALSALYNADRINGFQQWAHYASGGTYYLQFNDINTTSNNGFIYSVNATNKVLSFQNSPLVPTPSTLISTTQAVNGAYLTNNYGALASPNIWGNTQQYADGAVLATVSTAAHRFFLSPSNLTLTDPTTGSTLYGPNYISFQSPSGTNTIDIAPAYPFPTGGKNVISVRNLTGVMALLGDIVNYTDAFTTGTDANQSLSIPYTWLTLPAITANRLVTIPTGATYTGKNIKIHNTYTGTSFTWSFSGGTVKDIAGNTLTTLSANTLYVLEYNGTNWIKIN
jgi:hypothetical protein